MSLTTHLADTVEGINCSTGEDTGKILSVSSLHLNQFTVLQHPASLLWDKQHCGCLCLHLLPVKAMHKKSVSGRKASQSSLQLTALPAGFQLAENPAFFCTAFRAVLHE